jgi:hypothetical protein
VACKRPDAARIAGRALDLPQLDTLLKVYRGALPELRAWRDPCVSALIVKLEMLQLEASRDRRYLIESRRTASRL